MSFRWISQIVVGSAVLMALVPGAAQGQTISFGNDLKYTGDCVANNLWGGAANPIGAYAGMVFGGIHALDVNHYQSTCWGNNAPNNGYLVGGQPVAPVLGLLRSPGFIQKGGGELFNLLSMNVGSGWTDVRLTFRGYDGWKNQNPAALYETYFDITPFGLTNLTFGWTGVRYIEIDFKYAANDPYAIVARTAEELYQTSFLAGITVEPVRVPEPASVALLGLGLLGLGAAARRRNAR